jgi:hypothetical protein
MHSLEEVVLNECKHEGSINYWNPVSHILAHPVLYSLAITLPFTTMRFVRQQLENFEASEVANFLAPFLMFKLGIGAASTFKKNWRDRLSAVTPESKRSWPRTLLANPSLWGVATALLFYDAGMAEVGNMIREGGEDVFDRLVIKRDIELIAMAAGTGVEQLAKNIDVSLSIKSNSWKERLSKLSMLGALPGFFFGVKYFSELAGINLPAKGLSSGFFGAGALQTISMASTFLGFEDTREAFGAHFQKVKATIRGDLEAKIEAQERIVGLGREIKYQVKDLVVLGQHYEEAGNQEAADASYRKALRIHGKRSSERTRFEWLRNLLNFKGYNKKSKDPLINILIGACESRSEYASHLILEMQYLSTPEEAYRTAKALEVVGQNRGATRIKLRTVHELLEDEELSDLVTDSKNEVSIFGGDDFFKTELVLKASADPLKEGKKMQWLNHKLRKQDVYYVPRPIGLVPHEGKEYVCMEYEPGVSLRERFESGNLLTSEEIFRVTDGIALISSMLKTKEGNVRDSKAYLEERLDCDYLVRDDLEYGLSACWNSLEGLPIVLDQDSQPGNIQLNEEGQVIFLDHEYEKVSPIVYEMESLLEYFPGLSKEFKLEVIGTFIDRYEVRSRRRIDRDQFLLGYANAAIIRALERAPNFTDEREHMRIAQINNALSWIDEIEESFPEYYVSNRDKYAALEDALDGLLIEWGYSVAL